MTTCLTLPTITINSKHWETLEGLEAIIDKTYQETLLHFKDFKGKMFFVDVTLTDDQDMQKINLTHRQKDKPTNVLSFPQYPSFISLREKNNIFLGDLVLSYSTIYKEAVDFNLNFIDHLSHLIVHGTLHLLGFDHEEEKDAEEMEALEITILQKLGIKNPYSLE